ncbi:MAG: hypothetical protein JAZ17_09520 [Candidatus Thiodiazotropha endolucinida]|nr:hypothetical protein [Candidatus Thiodiazotropha endolucinida]
MTNTIHSAVLALESIYQRLYRIETASILLQGIEHGEIKDLENTSVTFNTMASEALNCALTGIFDACEQIEEHLQVAGGKLFIDLRAEAEKEAKKMGDQL